MFNSPTSVPKGAFDTYWTTRRTTEVLARSARDAVTNARATRHYSGPSQVSYALNRASNSSLKIYVPNTFSDDPLRQNLQFILTPLFKSGFGRPSEWYTDGFDRYASAFDLMYGDVQQMSLYADPQLYTSLSLPDESAAALYGRLQSHTDRRPRRARHTAAAFESLLIEGYDFAKSRGMVYVPYPLAWARAYKSDAALVRPPCSDVNDWLTYMLANMLYTTVTDRFLPPEKVKPQHANTDHPRGWHDLCARIGFDTLRQLTRHELVNALLEQRHLSDRHRPARLCQHPPARSPRARDRVFCATDLPASPSPARVAGLHAGQLRHRADHPHPARHQRAFAFLPHHGQRPVRGQEH